LLHPFGILAGVKKPKIPFPLVDLFAGCGGLSLGLENAGFTPVFVNELNRDAMESYLVNRNDNSIDLRLQNRHIHDIRSLSNGSGSIEDLARFLRLEHGEIALVAGGPPCQGYSGIGHRRTFSGVTKSQVPSNHLYGEMAKFVEAVQPRMFLFENVRGLLSSRWTPEGSKGEIWEDVIETFSNIGGRKGLKAYSIGWSLVYAKDYGVPQNRPRVLMIGIREDLHWHPKSSVAGGRLPDPSGKAPDLEALLSDLVDASWKRKGITESYPSAALNDVQRNLRRENGRVRRKGEPVTEMEYSNHSDEVIEKFRYMIKNNGKIPAAMQTKKFAQRLLPRRWGPAGPTITATSLADDYVHFSQPRVLTVREWARLQLFPDWYQFAGSRTTGGRRRAGDPDKGDWSRDVPKYTQIGNAVPVALAEQVGMHLRDLLNG
jgi:DNA (cytosine-5)-methyltransferase 1